MAPLSAILFIDKASPWVASLGAFIATEAAPGPFVDWTQGGVVGLVILLFAYAIRGLFEKLEQARGDKIKALESEGEEQKQVIEELKREIQDLKTEIRGLRRDGEGVGHG